jgi:hypothetical protein
MGIPLMTTQGIIALASAHLASLAGHTFNVLTVTKPVSRYTTSTYGGVGGRSREAPPTRFFFGISE